MASYSSPQMQGCMGHISCHSVGLISLAYRGFTLHVLRQIINLWGKSFLQGAFDVNLLHERNKAVSF